MDFGLVLIFLGGILVALILIRNGQRMQEMAKSVPYPFGPLQAKIAIVMFIGAIVILCCFIPLSIASFLSK